jgi:hypothetical protein
MFTALYFFVVIYIPQAKPRAFTTIPVCRVAVAEPCVGCVRQSIRCSLRAYIGSPGVMNLLQNRPEWCLSILWSDFAAHLKHDPYLVVMPVDYLACAHSHVAVYFPKFADQHIPPANEIRRDFTSLH